MPAHVPHLLAGQTDPSARLQNHETMHGLIRAAWPDAPWAAAAAVTVMAMLALVLLVQLGTTLYGRLCWRAGAYRKSDTEPPRLPTPAQFCESCLYLLGAVIVWSLFPASWYYGRPGFFATAYLFLAAFVIADAIFYGVHRWLHHNKTASRLIHGRHHHRIDNLGKGTFLDGLLTIGTGSTAVYLLTYAVVGNFNSFLLAVQGMAVHGMALHNSPDAMRFQHPAELSIVLLCPQMLLLLMLPIMQRGYQHLQHHTHSRWGGSAFRRHRHPVSQTRPVCCHPLIWHCQAGAAQASASSSQH